METSHSQPSIELSPGVAITQIVVPVALDPGYDRGIAAAAALAERFGLPLRLVSVDVGDPDVITLKRGEAMTAAVEALAAAHPGLTLDEEVIGAGAHPAAAFAELVSSTDLVVIATEAMEGPGASFAQEAVSLSPVPMLLLGPQATLGDLKGDVMVAVDGSVLAERIIPAARSFAAALDAKVELVEVVPGAISAHVERLKAQGHRVSESAYVCDLHERLGDSSIGWEVIHADDPSSALCDETRRRRPAVLAMATHGREGFVAQVFGSVALSVARDAVCPVLVQCPVGQPSPLELT